MRWLFIRRIHFKYQQSGGGDCIFRIFSNFNSYSAALLNEEKAAALVRQKFTESFFFFLACLYFLSKRKLESWELKMFLLLQRRLAHSLMLRKEMSRNGKEMVRKPMKNQQKHKRNKIL